MSGLGVPPHPGAAALGGAGQTDGERRQEALRAGAPAKRREAGTRDRGGAHRQSRSRSRRGAARAPGTRPRGRRGLRARGPSDNVERGRRLEVVGLLTSWEQGSPGPSGQGHPPADNLEQMRLLSRWVEPRTGTGWGFRPSYTSVTALCKEGLQVKAGLRGQQGRGRLTAAAGFRCSGAGPQDLLRPQLGTQGPSPACPQTSCVPFPLPFTHSLPGTGQGGQGESGTRVRERLPPCPLPQGGCSSCFKDTDAWELEAGIPHAARD